MAVNLEKIKKNLKNLIDLNDESYPPANTEIGVVYGYLSATDNHDNGVNLFGDLLIEGLSLIGDIDNPAAPIVAWFLSGLVNSYNTSTPASLLSPDITQISSRYVATYLQIDTDLITILNDTENNLDKEFTIPDNLNLPAPYNDKKIIKVRELGEDNCNVPAKYSDDFNTLKNAFVIGFRNRLVKQELPRINNYAIGAVHIKYGTKYWLYIAQDPPGGDKINWTGGDWTITNIELQLQGRDVKVSGNSFEDFNKIAGSFNEQSGSLIVVEGKTDSSISYKKYYMLQGFSDGEWSGWNLGSNDFYNWLFKDDGFGNIMRPNSIGMRDDIFRNWGITNGNLLPNSIN